MIGMYRLRRLSHLGYLNDSLFKTKMVAVGVAVAVWIVVVVVVVVVVGVGVAVDMKQSIHGERNER